MSVVNLGVGKNMVSSIRFWLKAYGLTDENDNSTDLADFLFGENGRDPYLEDFGTLWLLHYSLVVTGRSSIYNLFFNDFKKERDEFTKDHLHSFLSRKTLELEGTEANSNTLTSDVSVFLRNYRSPRKGDKIEIEEDFSSVLVDLGLLFNHRAPNGNDKLVDWYRIESKERVDLPYQIILFSILDNPSFENTISFKELLVNPNSPGMVFSLNQDGLYQKIQNIQEEYQSVIYTETAGNQVLQFKSKPNKWDVLNDYYGY